MGSDEPNLDDGLHRRVVDGRDWSIVLEGFHESRIRDALFS